MTNEEWGLVIEIFGVVTSLLVAVIAIWGERIRQLWAKPKLVVALNEPTLTSHQESTKRGWYYHVKVINTRKSAPARNVRVHLCRIFKKGSSQEWREQRSTLPVQVSWRWPQITPPLTTLGPDDDATFGRLIQGANAFELVLLWYPLNVPAQLGANESMRIELKAVSDDSESKPILIEIDWNGAWDQSGERMSKHLSVRLIQE